MKILIGAIFFFFYAYGANAVKDKSYVIDADEVEYDDNTQTVIAKGHVEIFRDDYTLKADKITYNKDTKKAYAIGNVVMLSPNGDVIKSDNIEVDNTLKQAITELATARFDNDSKFTAEKVHYYYPNITIFKKVSYTPCALCEGKAPEWQIKSSKVSYEKQKNVSYLHNTFEIYGVPVLYIPYFVTSAPDAPPRSGFLFPTQQKYKSIYGYGITVPFYYRIAENKDLLYSPIITTKKGVLHQAEFRHLMKNGSYKLDGNYIHTKNSSSINVPSHRYHVKGKMDYQFNDNWFMDAKLDRISDKSYLHNYWGHSLNNLTSNASLHYVDKHDYGSVETYSFQGLRSQDSKKTDPTILPLMNYHKEYFAPGGKYIFETNVANVARSHAVNSSRISTKLGWDKTYYYNYQELSILRSFKMDMYHFKDKSDAEASSGVANNKKQVIRAVPELEVLWKYPLVSKAAKNSFYLEPIMDLIVSPNNSKNDEIVNEDSKAVEITDANLFSSNRYSGFDRVESGTRISYGAFASGIIENGMEYNALIGQSYIFKKNDDYGIESGMRDKNFSDYVGRTGFKPNKFLELYYRGRLDSKTYNLRRNEVGANFDMDVTHDIIDKVHFHVNYIHYDYLSTIENTKVYKSIGLVGTVNFYKKWYLNGEFRKNASKLGSFMVGSKVGVGYKSDCTQLQLSAMKDFTKDPSRNIKPTNGISLDLEIHLKNIN